MLDWDHNAYYHRELLRRLPRRTRRVLEVGCGVGHLALRLAERADHVDAVDIDPLMVKATQAIVPSNVSCRRADVMADVMPPDSYDAIVSLSVLHHLDLQPALTRFADALRPGGVLVAVALPRVDLPSELLVELTAACVHNAIGLILALTRHPLSTGLPHPAHPGAVPLKDPVLTTRQVRAAARDVLPSVKVRRLLLWRYSLTWQKVHGQLRNIEAGACGVEAGGHGALLEMSEPCCYQ